MVNLLLAHFKLERRMLPLALPRDSEPDNERSQADDDVAVPVPSLLVLCLGCCLEQERKICHVDFAVRVRLV